MTNIVEKFILPWKVLLVFVVVIAVIAVIQLMIALGIASNTVQAGDTTCAVKSVDVSGERLTALLDCGESGETGTNNVRLIAAYIKGQKQFICTLYGGVGATECKF